MAQKLFVGGLSFNTTNDGLRDFFAQSGTVVSANVVTEQFSGRSKGFGFVEMESSTLRMPSPSSTDVNWMAGKSRSRLRSRKLTDGATRTVEGMGGVVAAAAGVS